VEKKYIYILNGTPSRKDLCVETEESPLLEAVMREQLVKTQQARKSLAGAAVIRGDKRWRCNRL
jgi:hypothetical protein